MAGHQVYPAYLNIFISLVGYGAMDKVRLTRERGREREREEGGRLKGENWEDKRKQ